MLRSVGRACFAIVTVSPVLAGCTATASRCSGPPIPAIGTTGAVTVELTPAGDGVETDFHERQWLVLNTHLNQSARAAGGTATVEPAKPFPVLRVVTATGQTLTMTLEVLGCA